MKDPATFGAVVSAGVLLVLSVWKTRYLRWIAIVLLLVTLGWMRVAGAFDA